jgi:hypothetical protein
MKEEGEMSWSCSMHREMRKANRILFGKCEGNIELERPTLR